MRIVVYASASPNTPESFKKAALKLGRLLADGGHTCVNGGGDHGGMGALNRGCRERGGKLKVVIHTKWCVDGTAFDLGDAGEGVAVGGPDLAERKRGLLEGADAVIALPGGIGTMDELCDVACQKQLGFAPDIPICLVNVGGYFDGILRQLQHGHDMKLISQQPDTLMHSEPTPEKALAFCVNYVPARKGEEEVLGNTGGQQKPPVSSSETAPSPTTTTTSALTLAKSIAMLPFILACYTWLFYKTVNVLMWFSGEKSDVALADGITATGLPWYVEMLSVIGILLVACKNLK